MDPDQDGPGLTAEDLDAQAAVTAMLGFYTDERATDVDLDADGDMFLFQWGTFDWGTGPSFEYNITRQLAIELDDDLWADDDDDEDLGEGIWQHPRRECRSPRTQLISSPGNEYPYSGAVRPPGAG